MIFQYVRSKQDVIIFELPEERPDVGKVDALVVHIEAFRRARFSLGNYPDMPEADRNDGAARLLWNSFWEEQVRERQPA